MTSDRSKIYDEIDAMADEAAKRCGLSYRVYVEHFSELVNEKFGAAEMCVRDMAIEIAGHYDYATPEELELRDKSEAFSRERSL